MKSEQESHARGQAKIIRKSVGKVTGEARDSRNN